MLRWTLLSAALVISVGCGGKSVPPLLPIDDVDGGETDGGETDGGATGSTLVVRTAGGESLYVMLGSDPATTQQGAMTDGAISFTDVVFPVNVTAIAQQGGRTEVLTLHAVNANEVVLPGEPTPSASAGTVSGEITGFTVGSSSRRVSAHFFDGATATTTDVTTSMGRRLYTLSTPLTGDFWASSYEAQAGTPASRKAGLNRTNRNLAENGTTTGADVSIALGFTGVLPVTITNGNDFAGFTGTVTYTFAPDAASTVRVAFPEALTLFTGETGNLAALPATAPFDDPTYGAIITAQTSGGSSRVIQNGIAALTDGATATVLGFATIASNALPDPSGLQLTFTAPEVASAELLVLTDATVSSSGVVADDATFTWRNYFPPTGQERVWAPFELPVAAGGPTSVPVNAGAACTFAAPQVGCYTAIVQAVDLPAVTYGQAVSRRLGESELAVLPLVRSSTRRTQVDVRQ